MKLNEVNKKLLIVIVTIAVLLCVGSGIVKSSKNRISDDTLKTETAETNKPEEVGMDVSDLEDDSPSVTYRISPQSCYFLFDDTPEEFLPKADSFYGWTDDFSRKAEVDEEGYLLLTLSEKKIEEWSKSYDSYFEEVEKNDRITVSDDYKKITIIGYKETIARDIVSAWFLELGCRVKQFLNTPDGDLKIERVIIDGGTGEVKSHRIVPSGESHELVHSEFSSIYQQAQP